MDQKIINLFDEYTHKPLTRQDFISRLIKLTGSTAAAMAVLPLLEVNYAHATTVRENDDDIIIENITYEGDGSTMKGYLARPSKTGKYGSVVVIHENRGLNAHIQDVTRRVAKAGYLAVAPDALSPFGGTPPNEDEARGLFSKLDKEKNLHNFAKALDYLKARPESNGKTACVGCIGGVKMRGGIILNAVVIPGQTPYQFTVPFFTCCITAFGQLNFGQPIGSDPRRFFASNSLIGFVDNGLPLCVNLVIERAFGWLTFCRRMRWAAQIARL